MVLWEFKEEQRLPETTPTDVVLAETLKRELVMWTRILKVKAYLKICGLADEFVDLLGNSEFLVLLEVTSRELVLDSAENSDGSSILDFWLSIDLACRIVSMFFA